MFFLGPIGGVITDRMNRRDLIVIGQSIVFISEFIIFILIFNNRLEFWHLLCSAGIIGCVLPFIMPARNAIIVNIVGKSGIGRAMAINMAGVNTTRVLGPAIAGFLIGTAGEACTYLVGVTLYGLGLLCMTRVNSSPPSAIMQKTSVTKSIVEGFTYVRDNRLVMALLLFGLVPLFLTMPVQNLFVVFAEKIWDVGSHGFGILSATMGIGGVAGSF